MIQWPSKRSRLVFHWWLKFTFSWMANKHWDFYINQRLNLFFPFLCCIINYCCQYVSILWSSIILKFYVDGVFLVKVCGNFLCGVIIELCQFVFGVKGDPLTNSVNIFKSFVVSSGSWNSTDFITTVFLCCYDCFFFLWIFFFLTLFS